MERFVINNFCGECLKKGKGVYCSIDPKEYHFLNTKGSYMLKGCPKCGTHYLLLPERR